MTEEVKAVETPKPTHTVVDNTNLPQMLAEARGEKYVPEVKDEVKPTEEKVEAKVEPENDLGLEKEQAADPKLTAIVRKAVDRKHRQFKEAEEFGEAQFEEKRLLAKKLEATERENARLKEQLAPAVEAPKEPKKADFKTDDEYQDAKIAWGVQQALDKRDREAHEAAQADRAREIFTTAEARITSAKELVHDFQEAIEAVPENITIATSTLGYMQESELFAELGYYYAKNLQEYEKLSKMSPAKQLVAIGKIESTLKPFAPSAEVEVKTPQGESKDGKAKADPSINGSKPSKARPEPIKPLETGSASQVEKPLSEMTLAEAKADFQKRTGVNLGLRKRH